MRNRIFLLMIFLSALILIPLKVNAQNYKYKVFYSLETGEIVISGISNFPDGTWLIGTIKYSIDARDYQALQQKIVVKEGKFEKHLKFTKRRLPFAEYKVIVEFDPNFQPRKLKATLGNRQYQKIESILSYGDKNMQKQLKEAEINLWENILENLNIQYLAVKEKYLKYYPVNTPDESKVDANKIDFDPADWEEWYAVWKRDVVKLKTDRENYVNNFLIPLMPKLSDEVKETTKMLLIIGEQCSDELYGKKRLIGSPIVSENRTIEVKSIEKMFLDFENIFFGRIRNLDVLKGDLDRNKIRNDLLAIKQLYIELSDYYNEAVENKTQIPMEVWVMKFQTWEVTRMALENQFEYYVKQNNSFAEKYRSIYENMALLPKDLKNLYNEAMEVLVKAQKPDKYKDLLGKFVYAYNIVRNAFGIKSKDTEILKVKKPEINISKPTVLTDELKKSVKAKIALFASDDNSIEWGIKMRELRKELIDLGTTILPLLANGLYDENKNVRNSCAYIIGEIRSPQAFTFLKDRINADKDKEKFIEVRGYCIEALGKLNPLPKNETTKLFLSLLETDKFMVIRAASARYLGFIGDKSSVVTLISHLDDIDETLPPEEGLIVAKACLKAITRIIGTNPNIKIEGKTKTELTTAKQMLLQSWQRINKED